MFDDTNENPAIQAKTFLRIRNSVSVYTLLPKTDSSNAILTQTFQMRQKEHLVDRVLSCNINRKTVFYETPARG